MAPKENEIEQRKDDLVDSTADIYLEILLPILLSYYFWVLP